MPVTKASKRSAAARKRWADRVHHEDHGQKPADATVLPNKVMQSEAVWDQEAMARTDEVLLPHEKKALTDSVGDSHGQTSISENSALLTDEVKLPHKKKALTDEVKLPHKKKALTIQDGHPIKRPKLHVPYQHLNSGINKPKPLSTLNECNLTTAQNLNENVTKSSQTFSERFSDDLFLTSSAFPQATFLRGSFHQADARFKENKNKQCVANSLVAIMSCHLKNVMTWTREDLDDVLKSGDDLYSTLKEQGKITDLDGYLYVNQLPSVYSLNNCNFALEYETEPSVGLFGVDPDDEMRNFLMSCDDAIRNVLVLYDTCFFTVAVSTCAIIKQDSWYMLVDSHSRSTDGRVADPRTGKSLVTYHKNIGSLLKHLSNLGMSLGAVNQQFEVTGVKVTVTDRNLGPKACSSSTEVQSSVIHVPCVDNTDDVFVSETLGEVQSNVIHVPYVDNTDDVVLVSETLGECYQFNPLTQQQQKSLCLKQNIVYVDHGREDFIDPVLMGSPCKTQAIIGDGNCFFRSLAFALTGSEREHLRIRRAVVSHMTKNETWYINNLREHYPSVADYVATSRMKYVGTWATEVEIQASADLLGVDIFTYTQNKWLKFSKCSLTSVHSVQDFGIYLKHCNESHYEAVTCVNRSDMEMCAGLCPSNLSKAKVSSLSRYELAKKRERYLKDEVYRDHIKKKSADEYKTHEQYRQKKKHLSISKYSTDPEHREQVKQLSIKKYASNEDHRGTLKKRSFEAYHSNPVHQASKKQISLHRYKTDSTYATATKTRNVEKLRKQVDKRKDIEYVTEQFRQKIKTGPEFVCSVCHRMLFRKQVVKCRREEYLKNPRISLVAQECITETYLHHCNNKCLAKCSIRAGPAGSLWICYTCRRKILNGKMPQESIMNNLALDPVPQELSSLNSVEQHLIGLHIPFMRLVALPKGSQNGVHGPVTCVPSNISSVTHILPRSENLDLMIRVKLKRKLTYKGHYEYEFVHPEKIKTALLYLKNHNAFYRDVQFNADWVNPLSKTPSEQCHEQEECVEDASSENIDEQMDDTLHDRQQHGMFMDTCLQPVDLAQEILDQHFDGILSVAPAEGNNPVRLLSDESNEAKCFPVLFPRGKGMFYDNRPQELTLCRYLNLRILNADGRFAKSTDYLFYAQYLSELNQVVSNVSIAVRKGYEAANRNNRITSDMLTDQESLQKILNYDDGYKFLRPIRGTPVFWQNVQKDLFAMVRQIGVPTWFMSFSSADLRWPEFIGTIMKQEGKDIPIDELDWSERCSLLKTNPVMAARMFDHRFQCFLKDVILSEAQPIGKIKDWFYRVEFQQRGSPHVHCLFWVENAPQIDREDDKEVVAFVDHYVSCEMPPRDHIMHEIVSGVQQHSKRHSKSCRKNKKTCRFNFPRPPSCRTFISRRKITTAEKNTEERYGEPSAKLVKMDISPPMEHELADAIMKRVKTALLDTESHFDTVHSFFASIGIDQAMFEAAYIKMTRKTSVILKRNPSDVWVNQYNQDLLRCWNANMDIQFVVDAYACIVYIISYISKAEREMGLLLSHTQKEASEQGNLDAKQALQKLGSVFLHNREVSAQESAYRLTNMKLKQGSRKVQFVPTGDAIRMSLPLDVIRKKAAHCGDPNIWMKSITDRYKGRPKTETFVKMCLASFASEYRVLSKSESSSCDCIKLDKDLGFVKKRTRTDAAVVRYARFSPTKTPEKYYQSILQLFLPHYVDGELKPLNFSTYQEHYENGFVKLGSGMSSVKTIVDSNMALFEKEADSIDQAQADLDLNGSIEDAWAQICPESECERLECLASKAVQANESEECFEVIPDLLPKPPCLTLQNDLCGITKQEAMTILRSLNEKQSQIFYKIRQWCLQKVQGKNPEAFHLFISGPGGVGKSMLIKAIYYEASRILSRLTENPEDTHVLLTAPTGVSAYNINAATIHSCFAIGTEIKLPYQPLGDDKINSLRVKFANLQIVIIDEISMVDHRLLAYIHGRLRQIKQPGDYSAFGKVSIIAVGDFYQLSPVRAKPLYIEHASVNLWHNNFALAELTEIMRQKDKEFAQLLNRLRTHKRGDPLLEADVNMLKQCERSEEEDSTALHIYATNEEAHGHNMHMLRKLCPNSIIIHAQDFERVAKTGRLVRKQGHHATVYKTCLSECIHIALNARVMLIKNLDLSDGLVNGIMGTVHKICFEEDKDFPLKIYVTFDHERPGKALRTKTPCPIRGLEKATPIGPEEERISNDGGLRRQFPLKLSWASTVHKVQGLSLKKAVVSLKKIFAAGQAYVALSRVTSKEGLIIQDFRENAIFSKQDVEVALQRMPVFIEPVKEMLQLTSCKIILHNVQGLTCHFQDIKQDCRVMAADIMCMTETWLNLCIDDVQLTGFVFHSLPRCLAYDNSTAVFAELKNQQHGGVGLYCSNRTNCSVIDLPCMNLECLLFTIPNMNVTAAVLYRPPSFSVATFLNRLLDLISYMDNFAGGKIVMGDFNENLFVVSTICNFIQSHGFTQVVKEATTEYGTLIDHVYIKDICSEHVRVSVIPTYFSCHECLLLDFIN